MLEFPSYSFLGFLPFAILGLICASFSIHFFYEWTKGAVKETSDNFGFLGLSLAGTVFLLVGIFGPYFNIKETYKFRNIDISQVSGFKVIKSDDEYSPDNSKQITINDAQAAQGILKSLKECYSISRNHETYQVGYKIKLLFEDKNLDQDFFISVYRLSNKINEKFVLMPHIGENRNLNLGEYGCPSFQEWVSKNIDPLFQNKSNLPK